MTLQQFLDARRWLFWERGMIVYWQELQEIATAALAGAGSAMPTGKATLGVCDLVTNFEPDVAVLVHMPGQDSRQPPVLIRGA